MGFPLCPDTELMPPRRTDLIRRARPPARSQRTDDRQLVFEQDVLATAINFQREILIDTWRRFKPPGSAVKNVPPDVMETMVGIVFGMMSGEELAWFHEHRKDLRRRLDSLIAELVLSEA
jgi:hypothetical protein